MTLQLKASQDTLREQSTHRFARLWTIDRTDGQQLRFTDASHKITYQGQVYDPTGGFSGTNVRRESGMREQTQDFRGILSSDKITDDDLRAERYSEAKITERLIDWKFPFGGAFYEVPYWVERVSWNGSEWTAEVAGISKWLNQKVGRIHTRVCGKDLGDGDCQVDLTNSSFNTDGVISTITTQRRIFTASAFVSKPTDEYKYGEITFTSGNNSGLSFNIKSNTITTSVIELMDPTPFDMTVGDTFSSTRGCDKLFETCRDDFLNEARYGGQRYMPSTDEALQSTI